ncbi:unnamed protein product, partial [Arabidopsis halleri]
MFALLLNGGFVFSDRDSQWCTAAAFLDLFLPVHGGRVFWLLGSWWSSKVGWRRRLRLILRGGCRRGPPRLRVSSLGHGSKCGSSVLQFDSECGGLVLLRCGNGFYVHSEKFSPCLVKIAKNLVRVLRLNRGGGSARGNNDENSSFFELRQSRNCPSFAVWNRCFFLGPPLMVFACVFLVVF